MKVINTLFALFFVFQATPSQDSVQSIRNYLHVNDQFCTGGQPRLEHLEMLKKEGVKAIINLRQPSEHRAAKKKRRRRISVCATSTFPLCSQISKDEQVDEFLRITDDVNNRPAFIHCTLLNASAPFG
jgi:protein tyrosine phosphatase (PTP) superfamily phosphohydrolase (DUF442 family)